MICTCGGYNENCYLCYGRGYYTAPTPQEVIVPARRRSTPRPKPRALRKAPPRPLVTCADCGAAVGNLEKHHRKVHRTINREVEANPTAALSAAGHPPKSAVAPVKHGTPLVIARGSRSCKHCGVVVRDMLEHMEKFHNPHAPRLVGRKAKRKSPARPPKPSRPPPRQLSPTSLSPAREERRPEAPMKPGKNNLAGAPCPECGVRVVRLAKHLKKVHSVSMSLQPEAPEVKGSIPKKKNRKLDIGAATAFMKSVGSPNEVQERQQDGSRLYSQNFREQGRFGSHASFDDYGDESHA